MVDLGILVIIAFPICGLIGYYMKTKNQERMKLIEQVVNPDEGLNISEYQNKPTLNYTHSQKLTHKPATHFCKRV